MLSKFKKFSPLLLIILTLLTRFIGISWGDGFFFHPDENNIVSVANSLSLPISNWRFFTRGTFSYGNLITNLIFFINLIRQKYLPSADNYSFIVLTSRAISALSSSILVYVVYRICQTRYTKKITIISTLLVILSPGLIQSAHFGTYESTITLFLFLSFYFCLKILDSPSKNNLVISIAFIAFATALKINSILLTPIPVLIYLFSPPQRPSVKKIILTIFFSSVFFIISVIILSPYYLTSSFWNMLGYEQQIVRGSQIVFYTRQFIGSTPILFSLLKVLPYQTTFLFIFIFIIYLPFLITKQIKGKKLILSYLLILFLPNTFLFTKWYRYMTPTIPYLVLFLVFGINQVSNSKFKNMVLAVLIITSIVSSLNFMSIYLRPDIRTTASDWINKNVATQATLLSEAGNVVDIPLYSGINTINFDFYNLDENSNLQNQLPNLLSQADYIIIPSRRIFKNQTNSLFPYSQKYYHALFNGQLGFNHLITFSPLPEFFNHENAEETFTVFDHPTIRLYQKTTSYDLTYYENLLLVK